MKRMYVILLFILFVVGSCKLDKKEDPTPSQPIFPRDFVYKNSINNPFKVYIGQSDAQTFKFTPTDFFNDLMNFEGHRIHFLNDSVIFYGDSISYVLSNDTVKVKMDQDYTPVFVYKNGQLEFHESRLYSRRGNHTPARISELLINIKLEDALYTLGYANFSQMTKNDTIVLCKRISYFN